LAPLHLPQNIRTIYGLKVGCKLKTTFKKERTLLKVRFKIKELQYFSLKCRSSKTNIIL
jgi:hypothetical protein